MSVRLYWDYHFRDPTLEAKLGSDREEHQGVWDLLRASSSTGKVACPFRT